MSHQEFVSWCQFRNLYGGLHLGLRLDRGISRAMALFGNILLRKQKFSDLDFSPYDKTDEEPADIEQVFGMMKAAAAQNNG